MTKQTPKVPSSNFDDVITALQEALTSLTALITPPLTPADRRRLMGAGIRRYGLIDRTMDYAAEFSQFAPPAFQIAVLRDAKHNIEVLRDLQILAEQINRLIADGLLIYGNIAFDQTLIYYNSVKELAKRNVPGARELYDKLNSLFKQRRSPDSPQTIKEIERDVHSLLHGKKDGEVVIKNERPHLVGGIHEVVDETHKEKIAAKEVTEIDS